jgi:hypothetical protein
MQGDLILPNRSIAFFHGGVFCHRELFKKGDFILPNRSIAFFGGSF